MTAGTTRAQASLRHYIGIARPDHWIKNVFMLPGVGVAYILMRHDRPPTVLYLLLIAAVSLCLAASANYTINEYLDAQYDRFHPTKRTRPGAEALLDGRIVLLEYLLLAAGACTGARLVNAPFAATTAALLAMGLVYNVAPVRTKDKAYLDTLSESINNPLRFLMGWFVIAPGFLPPASALLAYWMGGAFLMGVKRYSEYRSIGDPARAALYRRSFAHYTEQSLLLSSFFYALCSAFFIGIFLIKYRIEFLLTVPLYAALFTWYLAIGIRRDSAAQAPEKLYGEVAFLAFAGITLAITTALFFVDLPFLKSLMEPYVIRVPF
jgi:4-hydroxybenzoate polyprenyltransferase